MTTINKAEVGIGGYFKIEAVNAETGERRVLADWFKNLITDQGLNRLGTSTAVSHVSVGSGSTTPSTSDTQLASFVASTSNTTSTENGYVAGPPFYIWGRFVWRFAQGAAAGNLSEVGVGWAASASLFARSLIKDGNGNPTTITVLAAEFLDVTYEIRVYPPQSDVNFQVTISGQTYDCVLRPAGVTNTSFSWRPTVFMTGAYFANFGGNSYAVYDGTIGAITAFPSGNGTSNVVTSLTNNAYVNNSYQISAVMNCGLTQANLANGIRSFLFANSIGTYQVQFTPPIQKNSSQLLTLNLRMSWARRP